MFSKNITLLRPFFPAFFTMGLLLYLCCVSNPCLAQSPKDNKLVTLRHANIHTDDGKVIVSAYKAIRYMKAEQDSLFKEIKIYRLACPDFVFGKDYNEYFPGLNYKDADCIFKGEITPLVDAKFTFTDETAETGSTYAYWMAAGDGLPIGPLAINVRDQQVCWPYEKVVREIEKLKNLYPGQVVVAQIGKSVNRKPLMALKAGHGKKAIALIGAVHAGESGPELILPLLQKLLQNHAELLNKVSIIAIPSVNCDRRDKLAYGNPWYLRRNANDVDLNRNFPANWVNVDQTYGYETSDPDAQTYRGPYAGSEPETVAVMEFIKSNNPLAVFSFHCLASIAGETLGISKAGMDDKDYLNQCSKFADLYWQGTGSASSEQAKIVSLCTSGSLPDWCFRELGIPAFDMEAPFDKDDLEKCRYDKTDKKLLIKYQQIHYKGFLNILENL